MGAARELEARTTSPAVAASPAAAFVQLVHCILWTNAAAAPLGPREAGPGWVTQSAVLLHKRLSFLHLPIRDKGLELNTLNLAFNSITIGAANSK